ncbi:MAG: tetratricopeptide repeat protein, partial [Propionibacteriaceae bacterium]
HASMMGQGSSAQSTPAVDTQLEKKYLDALAANPNDVTALKELAKVYLVGGSDDQALEMERRVLALNPNDTDALLEYGVAYFNKGDYDAAEKQWLRVSEIDPANVECHYNLGFLYMTRPSPDQDKMQEHWNKVIELAPNSDMAKTVSGHISGGAATPTAKKS